MMGRSMRPLANVIAVTMRAAASIPRAMASLPRGGRRPGDGIAQARSAMGMSHRGASTNRGSGAVKNQIARIATEGARSTSIGLLQRRRRRICRGELHEADALAPGSLGRVVSHSGSSPPPILRFALCSPWLISHRPPRLGNPVPGPVPHAEWRPSLKAILAAALIITAMTLARGRMLRPIISYGNGPLGTHPYRARVLSPSRRISGLQISRPLAGRTNAGRRTSAPPVRSLASNCVVELSRLASASIDSFFVGHFGTPPARKTPGATRNPRVQAGT